MDGIAILVITLFSITFGPPVIFFIVGMFQRNKNPKASKEFFILAALWFIIGGGICATMMS